ncbi:single-stranded DNA-binding protein [Halomonas pacifica]|uniref:single-stranded DNA-binding protein n=1 Tax=Bisbaumannia pacifica TaxID=77098 RepID=UPI0023597A5A|nr:single-stranded DNA-binding protein [Halomonas pacifica]MDC8803890.1 single-stranded DNA-binding protein [Halomonas pacifica]
MANDMNHCHFTGRLGADPEVRFLPSGNPVANLRLAVGKQWRDKNSGEKQEATSWFTCVAFNKTAELAQQYLQKGAQIRVSCEAQERKWQDQQGNNRTAIEFVIREMQFLGGGRQQQGAQQQGGGYPQQGGQQSQGGYQQPAPGQYGAQHPAAPHPPGGEFDDEIPFAALHNACGG